MTVTNSKTYTVDLGLSAYGEQVNSKTFDLSQYVSDWQHISRLYIDTGYPYDTGWVNVSLKDPKYTLTVAGGIRNGDGGIERFVITHVIRKIEVKY